MADSFTLHYGWTKPDIGSDIDIWGNLLNADLDAIDAIVFGISGGGLAPAPNNTALGNVSGTTAVPINLTKTQLTTLINPVTSALSGAAPASGGGTANFLRADGTWATPPSVGSSAQDFYQSIAAIQAASIPAAQQLIVASSYATTGDLRGFFMAFERVPALPSFPGFVRSADRFLPNGSTDATNGGYWQLTNDIVIPQMFGATGGYNTNTATGPDDYTAFANMISYCNNFQNGPSFAMSIKKVEIPALGPNFVYYCGTMLSALVGGINIEGLTNNIDGLSGPTIYNPPNVAGILIGHDCNGMQIKNLTFQGNGGTVGSAHGIHVRRTTNFYNVSANGYSGCGFYLNGASDGAGPDGVGFIDLAHISCCVAVNNLQCGFFGFGADFNVNTFDHCSATGNRQYGFRTDGFLGNYFVDCHTNNNGTIQSGNSKCMVTQGGNTYSVIPVAENLALTAPSTSSPSTSPTIWAKVAADTTTYAGCFLAPWASGTDYQAGGGYGILDNSMRVFCYSESNQGPSSGGLFVGGADFQGILPGTAQTFGKGLQRGIELISTPPPGVAGYEIVTLDLAPQNGLGSETLTPTSVIIKMAGSITGPGFDVGFNNTTKNLTISQQNFAVPFIEFLGPSTTYTFGSAVTQAGAPAFNNFGIGANPGNSTSGILVQAFTAPFGPHTGLGWWMWNTNPVPGGTFAWQCTTAGVTGSTAVWQALSAPVPPCTVAQLPAAGIAGRRGFVTDANAATFNTAAAGGGSNPVPVFDTGAAWRIG